MTPEKEAKITKKDTGPLKIPAEALKAEVEVERKQFRELILAHPNYFGTLKESKLPPKKPMSNNTSYEELKCVGFNPETQYLEAVVHIKRTSGYGGDICTPGTPEFVRFFLSYDDGATWEGQGLTSFTAYDVPGTKPLEYSVRLWIDPDKWFCRFENLPKLRAILSWNHNPTPDDPDFTPVWGNRLETHIQIGAVHKLKIPDFVKHYKIDLTPVAELLDEEQELVAKPPKPPGPPELAPLYMKNDVQPHRLLFNQIILALKKPGQADALYAPAVQDVLKKYKLDLSDVIKTLKSTDGDTGFEELNCLGMYHSATDWLTATIKIKRRCGYNGGLCTPGSKEYVAFWVDWGDGTGWNHITTGMVTVHDLANLPAGGVEYTVSVPVNTLPHRQPCTSGPKTAKVRAILSWQDIPTGPNFVPTWGNREETLVLLKPGPAVIAEDNKMYVDSVGNMAVCDIDQSTGLATGTGQIAHFNAVQSPFGETVRITGFIINPPNAMANPAQTLKYRVSIRRLNDSGTAITGWQPLTNDFDIYITEQNGVSSPKQYKHKQQVDGDDFYTYWEQAYTNQWRQVVMDKIASWETLSLAAGLLEIKVEVKLPNGTILPPGTISCPDGSTRSTVIVRLDQRPPSASINITGYTYEGADFPAAGCDNFLKGCIIKGKYSTFDPEEHWGKLTIHVEPQDKAHYTPVTIIPATSDTTGETGTWTLDTKNMEPCGYVVYLRTWDRTIVDSGYIGWWNRDTVGFCLRLAE